VLAEEQRAPLVLERAGHDLRGARAAGVHEHDHGIVGLLRILVGAELLSLRLHAALRVDDEAVLQPGVADLHGLIQETARVVAKIEDEPLERLLRLLVQACQRLAQLLVRSLLEGADAHVGVAGREHAAVHGGHLHRIPRDRVGLGAIESVAEELDRDRGATRSAHELHGVEEGHGLGETAILVPVVGARLRTDRDDLILRLETRQRRRRAVDR
jgi:hypothetical protein